MSVVVVLVAIVVVAVLIFTSDTYGEVLVLLMSVNPGFGGQAFIPSTLDKLRVVRQKIDASGRDIRLEVDGGVKADNIGAIAAAGADAFVAGSAIFNAPDYRAVIDAMRTNVAAARG